MYKIIIMLLLSINVFAADFFDKNGLKIVTPDKKDGYYQYAKITDPDNETQVKNHYVKDIEPWLVWGYSPKDVSTVEERLQVLTSTAKGKAGFEKYILGKSGPYDRYLKKKK